MSSEIDICNLALSHLGQLANVSSFEEASPDSDHCKMFYPIARDLCLNEGWSFNTRRVSLSQLEAVPPGKWQYAYSVPNPMLGALSLFSPVIPEDAACPIKFVMETDDDGGLILLTDLDQAILRYTLKIEDTTKFSPLFVDCLSWLLASYLAGPILKGQTGITAGRAAYQTYTAQLEHARAKDNNQSLQLQDQTPAGIMARYTSGPMVGWPIERF